MVQMRQITQIKIIVSIKVGVMLTVSGLGSVLVKIAAGLHTYCSVTYLGVTDEPATSASGWGWDDCSSLWP